jgi:predicted dehydrogenase
MTEQTIRWGITGTARIARDGFLPALRAAGGGVAYAVGGRDPERTRRFAAENGVQHVRESYRAVCEDPDVDAVYVPTPNGVHAEITIMALEAGKAVLCEKPLCGNVEQTANVLKVARRSVRPLWEAFVFPFHDQTRQILDLLANGAIGTLMQVDSSFHFRPESRNDVRYRPELAGGPTQDVGCYAIRLSRLLMSSEPEMALSKAVWAPEGVDEEMNGILGFPGNRYMVFSWSMRMPGQSFTRLLGTGGEIRLTNPYHARTTDTIEVIVGEDTQTILAGSAEPTFAPCIRHIHAALRGEEEPRHLAVDEAMGNAVAIEMVFESARRAEA